MPTAYTNRAFFKEALIYQIYPASFRDSNGDGFGDLNGIRSKLDYLQSFGADVLWLSPIYQSPLKDMGYDISNYRVIDQRYGTLEDWDALVADLHSRGMKLMMDLVVNHTSDQHEWFLASRSSKTHNPKRDWYIWRPAKYSANGTRNPPNNWESEFGGSAWEWDELTQEYYLHLYVREQPDLNWENAEVREAVWELMLWWLSRGADGFRMDVINLISKTPGLPDAKVVDPSRPFHTGHVYYVNGYPQLNDYSFQIYSDILFSSPKVHDYLQEMHRRVFSNYPEALTVGEAPFTHDADDLVKFIQPDRNELQMIFQFELADLDSHPSNALIPAKYPLSALKGVINKWQRYMYENNGWNTVYLENHDLARSVSRYLGFGSDTDQTSGKDIVPAEDTMRARGAKLLCLLQTTQGGTLYVYQGQELGMANVPKHWGIEEYKDVATINFYNEALERRSKKSPNPDMGDIINGINKKARDNARTPVQWDDSPHAGFTSPTAQPWMRVNEDFPRWNAASQVNNSKSVHAFWKSAITVRKAHPVLTYGDFTLISEENECIFAYTRTMEDVTALVILNFTEKAVKYTDAIPRRNKLARLVLGNVSRGIHQINLSDFVLTLEPYEGRVYFTGEEPF
ncbi:glycoside hydrolase family 13 protein [Ramaria rubella]|nr:glycoside hydrolase family 13 protein [Ramaria rubella]